MSAHPFHRIYLVKLAARRQRCQEWPQADWLCNGNGHNEPTRRATSVGSRRLQGARVGAGGNFIPQLREACANLSDRNECQRWTGETTGEQGFPLS